MNKRVLMLTAATTALLSGHAYAASPCNAATSTAGNCDIITAIATPLYTGTAPTGVTNAQGGLGNITLDTASSLTIGTNPPTGPALTINSNNTVTNVTTISYQGINDTVGVLLEEASVPTTATGTGSIGNPENFTGEYYSSTGNIDLLGAGIGKNGILIAGGAFTGTSGTTNAATGVYANTGLGVFTGTTGFEPVGGTGPVAIDIASGSVIEVQGTNSFGINLIGPTFTTPVSSTTPVPSGGGSLIGDIDVGGSIQMTPVTVGSTTSGEGNVAINIAGYLPPSATPNLANPAFAGTPYAGSNAAMVGNINILPGGAVSSEGEGAEGVVILGGLQGSIINQGSISTDGTSAQPSTATNAADPEGGPALLISNNVSGGIFNSGSRVGSAIASSSISMVGDAETIGIAPTGQVQLPITIGGFTDSSGYTYSLLNRGTISAEPEDANLSTTAIKMAGNAGATVSLTSGIFNSGAITAAAGTNADGPTTDNTVVATALQIGNYVTIGNGLGGPSTGGTPYALVNSNETGSGTISASVAGAESGQAIAVLVQGASAGTATPGSLPSIYNSGTISASVSTTNLLLTAPSLGAHGIAAIAIEDESGTLQTIYNSGTISATATQLDDNSQLALAIDVSSNITTPVTVTDQATVTNPAVINGDIQFGSQPATLKIIGISATDSALVNGNLTFNNKTAMHDTLTIGVDAEFSGQIFQPGNGTVDVSIANTGVMSYLTSQPTNVNATVSVAPAPTTPLNVGSLAIDDGGNLTLSLSQGNNVNAASNSGHDVSVIDAQTVNIAGTHATPAVSLAFGGFVGTPSASGTPSEFVLISVPAGGTFTISPEKLTVLANTYDSALNVPSATSPIPFLFTSAICTYNVPGATGNEVCTGTAPYNSTNQDLVLVLTPKTATQLGLTGYAKTMFTYVNEALVNDNTLGGAMVTDIKNTAEAQAAYASFAPDVSGATRATAISLTDSATNVVAARQRELRMYANQEGDTTLWGQQFGERLSQANGNNLTGYNDSGFGFVLGMDDGDPIDGRYGGAFTFFSGGMSQKEPTSAKTASEYYLLTGYTDWRGKGLFIDTQLTAGYGNLKGHRYLTLTDQTDQVTVAREADGNRPTELLAGSVTTGGIFTAGGTVFMPQLDVDALSSREEAYTEGNGGQGFDLRVQPYYANSLRAFLGMDLRQDVNFGDFYLQPDLRFGYRYDFVDGAVKLKANFASVNSLNAGTLDQFTVEGPDPGRGNLVLGGGFATTTGAWSIGVSYDYVRAGSGPSEQTGILTLLGRI